MNTGKFRSSSFGTAHATSYWARVVQPWAANQWGTQFIPRVGMEVLGRIRAGRS